MTQDVQKRNILVRVPRADNHVWEENSVVYIKIHQLIISIFTKCNTSTKDLIQALMGSR